MNWFHSQIECIWNFVIACLFKIPLVLITSLAFLVSIHIFPWFPNYLPAAGLIRRTSRPVWGDGCAWFVLHRVFHAWLILFFKMSGGRTCRTHRSARSGECDGFVPCRLFNLIAGFFALNLVSEYFFGSKFCSHFLGNGDRLGLRTSRFIWGDECADPVFVVSSLCIFCLKISLNCTFCAFQFAQWFLCFDFSLSQSDDGLTWRTSRFFWGDECAVSVPVAFHSCCFRHFIFCRPCCPKRRRIDQAYFSLLRRRWVRRVHPRRFFSRAFFFSLGLFCA